MTKDFYTPDEVRKVLRETRVDILKQVKPNVAKTIELGKTYSNEWKLATIYKSAVNRSFNELEIRFGVEK